MNIASFVKRYLTTINILKFPENIKKSNISHTIEKPKVAAIIIDHVFFLSAVESISVNSFISKSVFLCFKHVLLKPKCVLA